MVNCQFMEMYILRLLEDEGKIGILCSEEANPMPHLSRFTVFLTITNHHTNLYYCHSNGNWIDVRESGIPKHGYLSTDTYEYR